MLCAKVSPLQEEGCSTTSEMAMEMVSEDGVGRNLHSKEAVNSFLCDVASSDCSVNQVTPANIGQQ